NGRRVLTYADLRTLGGPIDHRDAGRDIELHLTGHMERYIWSFSGQKFSEAEPIRFNYGERLRLVLVNDSICRACRCDATRTVCRNREREELGKHRANEPAAESEVGDRLPSPIAVR